MKLWIDNTGLQSAAQCLDGRAHPNHEYDVRGLLQLATLLVYGNKVFLNGFEDDKIATRSREIVDQLRALEITEDILSINPVNEAEYALACKTAAESIAPELRESFNPDEHMVLGGEPPDLPRGIQARQVEFVALASEPADSVRLRHVEQDALNDKAVGAVEYMLASSRNLQVEVGKMMAQHPHWKDRHSYQLNIFLRYHINDALGNQAFSKYAPAVARAELINRRNQYVIEALGDVVDQTVAELRGRTAWSAKYISGNLTEVER